RRAQLPRRPRRRRHGPDDGRSVRIHRQDPPGHAPFVRLAMSKPILVGAVAYDARVVPIWEGMRDYFRAPGPEIDYVLYSNYDRQVEALLAGQIDIAWNTNLAWAKVHHHTGGTCRVLAMRDVDAAYTTVLAARADRAVRSPADLGGMRVALGSAD